MMAKAGAGAPGARGLEPGRRWEQEQYSKGRKVCVCLSVCLPSFLSLAAGYPGLGRDAVDRDWVVKQS